MVTNKKRKSYFLKLFGYLKKEISFKIQKKINPNSSGNY